VGESGAELSVVGSGEEVDPVESELSGVGSGVDGAGSGLGGAGSGVDRVGSGLGGAGSGVDRAGSGLDGAGSGVEVDRAESVLGAAGSGGEVTTGLGVNVSGLILFCSSQSMMGLSELDSNCCISFKERGESNFAKSRFKVPRKSSVSDRLNAPLLSLQMT